jgi:hypothetical protein
MGLRYASVEDRDAWSGETTGWFVPWVYWKCGHRGFVYDWLRPGCCPRCGAECDVVSFNRGERRNG